LAFNLKSFGSYTAGGRIAHVTEGEPVRVQFTRQASMDVDPRGQFAIEQIFYSSQPKRLSSRCVSSRGWYVRQLLGNHARQTARLVTTITVARLRGSCGLLRSMEEAWSLFRFGSAPYFEKRIPFKGQRFPVEHFENFARSFTPRWTSTTDLQVSALRAVLQHTGPAMVICHSQGGELVFDAHNNEPELFAEIIALEPSNYPASAKTLTNTPTRIIIGDYLDVHPQWVERQSDWIKLSTEPGVELIGPDQFGKGNSHMLMMDTNSDVILDHALQR